MGVVSSTCHGSIQLRFGLHSFGQLAFCALVQHRDNRANNFQVTQLFGCDIEQQILAARIIFADRLGEIPARSTELSLRSAELLEQQIRKTRVRRGDTYGVLKTFVVNEHETSPVIGQSNSMRVRT